MPYANLPPLQKTGRETNPDHGLLSSGLPGDPMGVGYTPDTSTRLRPPRQRLSSHALPSKWDARTLKAGQTPTGMASVMSCQGL